MVAVKLQDLKKTMKEGYVEECVQAFGAEDFCKQKYVRELALMAHGGENDVALLLSLDQVGELDIKGALMENYGGQLVGNGIRFLLFHLFWFYVASNLISAAGLWEQPDQWGPLAEDSYFRCDIAHDCDFFTFVPGWRTQLRLGEVSVDACVIKDWSATTEIFRKIFRFFVVCEVLFQRYSVHQDFFSVPCIASSIGVAMQLSSGDVFSLFPPD